MRFRRRRGDDGIPDQRAGRVGVEVAFFAVPIVIVAVLFGFTLRTQGRVTRLSSHPDLTVKVTGYQWQWEFDYAGEGVVVRGGSGDDAPPELVLPVGATVRFELRTADVIHSFWVPEFLEKRDLIDGIDNAIDVHVDRAGTYTGRCAEFCGLDHYRMTFAVRAVDADTFAAWLEDQRS